MSRTASKREARVFQDAFRIYHEVEDVGKTVKASKRRARWTFCFGEDGPEKEVILIHSVVSGKKVVSYDGREIYHSDELSRAFSYHWYDGDHVLRLDIIDIVEVGTQMARSGGDRMYELTLDGVPFGVLPIKPVSLPGRRSAGRPAVPQSSSQRLSGSSSGFAEAGGDDDFNPRSASAASSAKASSSSTISKPKPAPKPSQPAVDLLGATEPVTFAPAPPAQDSFDPLARDGFGASSNAFMAPTSTSAASFDAFGPQASKPKVGAEQLAREFEGLTFTPRPAQQPSSTRTQGATSTSQAADFTAFQSAPSQEGGAGPGAAVDVDKATASLVNLTNLMDDSPAVPAPVTNVYRQAYTDHRTLEEIKASQGTKAAPGVAKPVMIERPVPPAFGPQGMPRGPVGMGMAPPMMGMGMGMAPYGPPGGGGGAGAGFGAPPPPMMGGMAPPPAPPMGMAMGMGMGMPFPQQPGPRAGFPQQPMMQQPSPFGMPSPAQPMMPQGGRPMIPPQPPKNDPFAGLGLP